MASWTASSDTKCRDTFLLDTKSFSELILQEHVGLHKLKVAKFLSIY